MLDRCDMQIGIEKGTLLILSLLYQKTKMVWSDINSTLCRQHILSLTINVQSNMETTKDYISVILLVLILQDPKGEEVLLIARYEVAKWSEKWKVKKVSNFLVFENYETFIYYRGCLNLSCYLSKKVQNKFLMGLKIWWSWGWGWTKSKIP